MAYFYGGVSDSIFGEQPYLEVTSTATDVKETFTIKFGIRAITKAISAGYTAKGTLQGNLEWKSYSKTITSTITKGSHFQVGSITIEKEKYNGSTREFLVTWDGHLDANAKGTFVSIASYYKDIPAITTYTVSYNVNGGSGTISSQTKVYGKSLTLTTTKPTRAGYNFVKWNTSSNGSGVNYASGGTYTANANAILYAQWSPITYTVSYNANGGTGAPANQTKTYNVTLKLSSTKPTRTDYNFVSWNEKADGTGTAHGAGTNYTDNKAITLYAIWEKAYKPPTINNLTAYRVDTNGQSDVEGVQAKVDFTWGVGSGSNNEPISPSNGVIKWKKTTESTYGNSVSFNNFPMNQNNTGGEISILIGATGSTLDTSFQYDVQVILTVDNHPDIVRTTYISVSSFIIDINTEGNAVGIGMAAPDNVNENQLWIDANVYLKKDLLLEKTDPRLRVKTFDANNTVVADGQLSASTGGNFGLYDQKHDKWLIRSDINGQSHFAPIAITTLYNTKTTASSTQETWVYSPVISNLANYNIVALRAEVHYIRQILFFLRPLGDMSQMVIDMSGTTYIRAQFIVDWTNNKIGVRWVNGTSDLSSGIYFQQVYGIM